MDQNPGRAQLVAMARHDLAHLEAGTIALATDDAALASAFPGDIP